MKKNTTLELIEQSSKVSLYSISFEMDHTTEFERFMCKFESESTLNKDTYSGRYPFSIPVIPVHFFVSKDRYLLRS